MNKNLTECRYCISCPGGLSDKLRNKKPCRETGKEVELSTPNCEKFSPADFFFCEKNEQRLSFAVCAARRFQCYGKIEAYYQCRKCSQFNTDIVHIVDCFIVKAEKRRNLHREITRRRKLERVISSHKEEVKKITRRKSNKKTITRRPK
jgi:hypothetical protein